MTFLIKKGSSQLVKSPTMNFSGSQDWRDHGNLPASYFPDTFWNQVGFKGNFTSDWSQAGENGETVIPGQGKDELGQWLKDNQYTTGYGWLNGRKYGALLDKDKNAIGAVDWTPTGDGFFWDKLVPGVVLGGLALGTGGAFGLGPLAGGGAASGAGASLAPELAQSAYAGFGGGTAAAGAGAAGAAASAMPSAESLAAFDQAMMQSLGGTGATVGTGASGGLGSVLSGAKEALGGLGKVGSMVKGVLGGTGAGGAASGVGLGDLASAIYGNYTNNQNKNQLKDTISGMQSMYGQDSPYAKYLRQTLDRKDAAAGRRSQYGPREVELQAKLAEMNSRNLPYLLDAQSKLATLNNRGAGNIQSFLQQSGVLPSLNNMSLENIIKKLTTQGQLPQQTPTPGDIDYGSTSDWINTISNDSMGTDWSEWPAQIGPNIPDWLPDEWFSNLMGP